MDCIDLKIKFINWDIIDEYPDIINKKFYKKLKEKAFDGILKYFS